MKDYRAEAEARFPFLTTAGHDHMAWAKRIQYRIEKGCGTLLPIQVAFARQALNLKPEAP